MKRGGILYMKIPPRGTRSVDEIDCDQNVKTIRKKVMNLTEWTYDSIRKVFDQVMRIDSEYK